MAELHFNEAIKHVNAAREPRLNMLYAVTPKVLELAAQTYAKDPKAAVNLLTQFGSANAIAWQQDWLKLGDALLGKYAMGMVDGHTGRLPAVVERGHRLSSRWSDSVDTSEGAWSRPRGGASWRAPPARLTPRPAQAGRGIRRGFVLVARTGGPLSAIVIPSPRRSRPTERARGNSERTPSGG